MNRILFFVLLLLLPAGTSFAQKSIFSGQVSDAQNEPLAGAGIKVIKSGRGEVAETSTDKDGLFYTRLLPSGSYKIVVWVGDKHTRPKKVYLPDETRQRSYFYLKVSGDKVVVKVDGQDPFLKARLSEIEKKDPRKILAIEGNVYRVKLKTGSAAGERKGAAQQVSGHAVRPMRLKDVH